MSNEENKDQQNQEGQEQLILGKFKNQDDLVKSYQELEKKLHSKQPSDPQSPEPSKDDEGDKEEFEWQKKNTALEAAEAVLHARKAEAAAALADDATLAAVRKSLGNKEAIDQFQKEFNEGQVSASEVRRLAAMSGNVKESTQTIPENTDENTALPSTAEQQEYLRMVSSPTGPAFNSSHPKHKEARERLQELKLKIYAA